MIVFEKTMLLEYRLVSINWELFNSSSTGGTTVGEHGSGSRARADARRSPKVGQAVKSLHILSLIYLDRHLRWRGSEIGNPGLAARWSIS